jgi:hypothetical protein
MPATPYKPVSWNGEPLSVAKLQQMTSNDQWLFENSPRIRYSVNGLTRDNGIKIISGKTFFAPAPIQHDYLDIYFGNFFSAGSHPVVTAVVEAGTGGLGRKHVTINGFGGEIDHRGFRAAVYTYEAPNLDVGGWCHWTAIGY